MQDATKKLDKLPIAMGAIFGILFWIVGILFVQLFPSEGFIVLRIIPWVAAIAGGSLGFAIGRSIRPKVAERKDH
jgi:hypothetical protein